MNPTPVGPGDSTPVEPVVPTSVEPVNPTADEPVNPTPVEPVNPTPVEPVSEVAIEPVALASVTEPAIPVSDVQVVKGGHELSIVDSAMTERKELPQTGYATNRYSLLGMLLISLTILFAYFVNRKTDIA